MQNTLEAPRRSFCDIYRPHAFGELVLPGDHHLRPALAFLKRPFASAWMLAGKPGLGKTSLARIMAGAAVQNPIEISHLVGLDLDANSVRDLARSVTQRPMWGNLRAYIVDECDSIPIGGQVRLLQVLETPGPNVWLFTSNESDCLDPRFRSRTKGLHFSSQGLLGPAAQWLQEIALKEGDTLEYSEAEKMIRGSKNNLREALQMLELRIMGRR